MGDCKKLCASEELQVKIFQEMKLGHGLAEMNLKIVPPSRHVDITSYGFLSGVGVILRSLSIICHASESQTLGWNLR